MADKEDQPKVGTSQLAKLFEVSEARIRQYDKKGIVKKAARGKYFLWPSIQGYIAYLKEQKVNQWDTADDSYNHHRSRLVKGRADEQEIKTALLKGEAYSAEAMDAIWSNLLSNFKARLMALPTKAAPMVQGVKKINEIKDILKEHVYDALNELSEYDGDKIRKEFTRKFGELFEGDQLGEDKTQDT